MKHFILLTLAMFALAACEKHSSTRAEAAPILPYAAPGKQAHCGAVQIAALKACFKAHSLGVKHPAYVEFGDRTIEYCERFADEQSEMTLPAK